MIYFFKKRGTALKEVDLSENSIKRVQKNICYLCNERIANETPKKSASWDHIIPQKIQKNLKNNRLLAHVECNNNRNCDDLTDIQFNRSIMIRHAAIAYELSLVTEIQNKRIERAKNAIK